MARNKDVSGVCDARGRQVVVGDKVVYNRSGYLTFGTVVRLTTRQDYASHYPEYKYYIYVVAEDEAKKMKHQRKSSKVQNTNNIINVKYLPV